MKTITINEFEPFLNVCSSKINCVLLRIINRYFWLKKTPVSYSLTGVSYITFNVALNLKVIYRKATFLLTVRIIDIITPFYLRTN